MVDKFHITEKDEYDYCVQHGIEPLIDDSNFTIDIKLRVELQESKFGTRKNIQSMNQKFFHWVWLHKDHFCEECGRPLPDYSATFCSHILSRGAHPEMATDGRNINILCFNHHQQYEFGDRQSMRIFAKNQQTIEKLKFEYSQLSAQLQFDFDKCTCKNCQHTGATVRFCFMRYGAHGDFEHITPDNYCKDFYSVDLPRFDDKTQHLK